MNISTCNGYKTKHHKKKDSNNKDGMIHTRSQVSSSAARSQSIGFQFTSSTHTSIHRT